MASARKPVVLPYSPHTCGHSREVFRTMEPKEYPPSFTSRSTSFIPFDQESDSRIILDDEKLPPVDGGVQAWLFLMASAMLEALVWGTWSLVLQSKIVVEPNMRAGYAFAFGIFQDYYSTHKPFEGSENIAVIGTCAMVSQEIQGRPALANTT